VGKSRRVLGKLTAALTEAGFDARWTDDIAGASQRFPPSRVDLVAFGRGVGGADRDVLLSERVPRGRRSIPLGTRPARRGATFAVVRVNATEVTVIEL
jgi:hypothetical protein